MKRKFFALLAACSAFQAAPALANPASEKAAADLFDRIQSDPKLLRMFLKDMPKGADLHNHASGAIWAEDYLAWAQDAGFCADEEGVALTPPPCAQGRSIAALVENDTFAFDRLLDAISTRGVQIGVGADEQSGHTQFFRSFERFWPIAGHSEVQVLASVLRLAQGDRVSYLELMENPSAFRWYAEAPDAPLDTGGLAAAYAREMAEVPAVITAAMAEMDETEAAVRAEFGCASATPDPACEVALHYLASGLRNHSPAQVFRLLILCFEMVRQDPRYVGVNFVEPEDWPISLRDYDLHMAMFRFLKQQYPEVRLTLHAGELTFARVPPAQLRNHMAKAIEAGAERVGHGTGIALEDDALATMQYMAGKGIAVEINLTSNAVILGVSGADHPLTLYRRFGVPVVLSTDDEGLLRTDLTNEYVRAAMEHGLGYRDLKELARASLTYSFLPDRERKVLIERLAEDSERFEKTKVAALADAMRAGPAKGGSAQLLAD
ncbi:conserved hypothetical protein [Altererythrobacter sp. B11]|uniref:adenosine deaminase family protein n=1 Tax=Altererythrobacter sp. B11 TaxID=2060312 RepID=UPI000DC70102|nr:adenosine deaminase [Altererythrobacter sp. B11]BBC73842.1 conserved hypothetical protein [Altererythrobacter sp. B11]